MELRYKQNESFGCGLYSVANTLLLNDSFVTPERIIESKNGNNLTQLNNWLRDDNMKLSIEPWYYNHNQEPLPESFFDYCPIDKDRYLPVLFDVKITEFAQRTHFIGGWIDCNKNLLVFDSLKNEVVKSSLKEMNDFYFKVFGLYHFLDDNNTYVSIVNPS